MVRILVVRNVCGHLEIFCRNGMRSSTSWTQRRWMLHGPVEASAKDTDATTAESGVSSICEDDDYLQEVNDKDAPLSKQKIMITINNDGGDAEPTTLDTLKKTPNLNRHGATLCTDTTLQDTLAKSMINTIHSHNDDEVAKVSDLVKIKAMPFNLTEGGRYVVDILKKTEARVVIIFVRSSVLANELVKELNENHLNATEIDESTQYGVDNGGRNRVLVVSDRMASRQLSLPPVDLVIQVQAPLSGVDAMKERLHVANFTSALATTLLLYNSNDSHFIAQLGQFSDINTIDSPSFHKLEEEDENWITDKSEVNLPAIHENIEKSPAVSRKVKTSLFKPVYPEERKNKSVGFVDKVRLYVIGGSGGNGSPRTGARGGDGGDVILECQARATLRHFRFKENRRPKAAHGQHCCIRAKRVNGQRGNDLIVPVPLGTVIKDEATGHVLADMDEVGRTLKVACGGRGGSPSTTEGGGGKGKRNMIILEYKMHTDVGLVGFPNAGKSTLLRALSNAKPKVAEYAFTSLKPTLGRVPYQDFSQLTVADLPGLIEGAHQNKGLGLKFLRHIERARLLLFVVDVNGFQLSSKHPKRTAFETIYLLAKELVSYRQNFTNTPKLLVINKMDCVGAEDEYRTIRKQIDDVFSADKVLPMDNLLEDNNDQVATINFEHHNILEEFRFEHVMATSALKQTGIEQLVSKLQEIITKNEQIRYLQ